MFLFSCLFGFVFPRLKYDFRSSRFCPSRYYGLAVCIKGLPSHPSFILANVAADHANESTTRWPHAAPSVHPRPNTLSPVRTAHACCALGAILGQRNYRVELAWAWAMTIECVMDPRLKYSSPEHPSFTFLRIRREKSKYIAKYI
jgi:hypothetical protein